ncbi:MAG: hypothetical protein K2J99_03205 [Lachnospiraceae bacterium]|nr:hypothetical protein [Lachnospiraceae bacterium]
MNLATTTIIKQPTTIYKTSATGSSKKTQSSNNFKDTLTESVVDTFKRRHPDRASHVDQQVRDGKAVRDRNGVAGLSTEDMTMEEYQAYFYALLDTIPYDSTRVNDTSIITISDEGWEQMRKDPDYEAWILGYFVEDRAVRNPFFGWGNDAGSIITEHFGASIEEHHGEGFSKAALKGNSDDDDEDDEENWWIKRHKRMKKLMREQVERSMKKDAAQKAAAKEEYARQQYISSQRQHNFLTSDTTIVTGDTAKPNPEGLAASMATAAYINTLDLFGSGAVGDVH